jgi:hypothetical protein
MGPNDLVVKFSGRQSRAQEQTTSKGALGGSSRLTTGRGRRQHPVEKLLFFETTALVVFMLSFLSGGWKRDKT